MSFDLNTRGVKRKLETIDSIDGGGVEPLSLDANDARRLKVSPACFQPSTTSPYPATALPEIETLIQHHGHHINTALVHDPLVLVANNNNNNIANAYKSIANSSLSSDDDNEDDDEEEDDDDEDEENEEDEDEEEEDEDVLLHQTYATNQSATDESFNASSSMESESGYDERVSNSSNDSTSDCSDYSPPSLMMTSSTVEGCIQPSCVSLPPAPPPPSLAALSSMYTPSSPSAPCNTSNNEVASKQASPSSFYYSHLPYYQSNHTSLRSKGNYMRQRQQIFNLSMTKLSRFRQSQDPSLYRSVLICNTLRRLEKEFEREGVKINFGPNGVSFISPVASPDLDFLPIAPHSSSSSNTSSVSPPSSPPPPAPSSPALLTMPVDCSLLPMPSSAHPQASFSSSVTEPSGYSAYPQVQCDPSLTSSSSTDYEKYFALENAPPSGRLTPYIKSAYPGEPEPYTATTSRLMEPLAAPTTTFWQSSHGDALCPSYYQPGGTAHLSSPVTPPSSGAMITATTSSSSCSTSASCPSSAPAPSSSATPSTPSNTVSSSLNLISSSYSSYLNYASNADEMFNDIDLSFSTIDIDRYDFDIFSPLSPPTTSTPTTATATSAPVPPINPKAMDEELITRTVNPTVTECNNNNNNNNNNNGENVVTLTTSTSTTTLLTLNNSYCSNSYSGYNSLSTYATPVLSPVPLSSPAMSTNCAAASSGSSGPGVHFNSSATRFYKPDERDQQKIATIKCHN